MKHLKHTTLEVRPTQDAVTAALPAALAAAQAARQSSAHNVAVVEVASLVAYTFASSFPSGTTTEQIVQGLLEVATRSGAS